MILFTISSAIRYAGAKIWLCQNHACGFIFRADLGRKVIRVVVPSLLEPTGSIPDERGTPTHIFKNVEQLIGWLSGLTAIPNQHELPILEVHE